MLYCLGNNAKKKSVHVHYRPKFFLEYFPSETESTDMEPTDMKNHLCITTSYYWSVQIYISLLMRTG